MALVSAARYRSSLDSEDALSAGALGFMPRILVLTSHPHRRPESHRAERVNGRIPFCTPRSGPSAQTGQRWRSTKLRGLMTSTPP